MAYQPAQTAQTLPAEALNPRQADRLRWEVSVQQSREEPGQPMRQDKISGGVEVGNGPPAVIEQPTPFVGVLARQIDAK
jgi:hypothetical protein